MALTASGFTPFTWPASNSGPYTVTENSTNRIVLVPNSSFATENDLATHKYHHLMRITRIENTIAIAFSSGRTNESDGGLQCGIIFSTNRGVSWSSPVQVVPSQSEWTNSPGAYLAGSRLSYPRNFTLYNGTNYLTCSVDNVTTNSVFSGAALLSCAVYSDGTIGTLFRITTNSYPVVDGRSVPSYDSTLGPPLLDDSKVYGTWGGSYPTSAGNPQSDWPGWLFRDPRIWTEPNTFSADGSTTNLYRIWRMAGETGSAITNLNYVWQQQSTNSGTSWTSDPVMTAIPNNPSEVAGIRLSTGQFAILGNPVRYDAGSVNRDPLFLAISDQTGNITNVSGLVQGISGTPVYASGSKGGGAQYPGLMQFGNYIYSAYSLRKEDIGFSRTLIPGLEDSNNDFYQASATSTLNVGTLIKR